MGFNKKYLFLANNNNTMEQDDNNMIERQEKFLETICQTEMVWALEKEDGFATASSINFEDEEGEPAEVLCFWSSKELAQACSKDDWEGYTPIEIPLTDFIENWCIGMDNDLIMAGIEFDDELAGNEEDPLELILEINEVLQKLNKKIQLQNYKSMSDLADEVTKILEN